MLEAGTQNFLRYRGLSRFRANPRETLDRAGSINLRDRASKKVLRIRCTGSGSHKGSGAGIGAIVLAIAGGGPVLGSLHLIFFSSSITPEIAPRKYLSSMTVKEIERRWFVANNARGQMA
jgi:hypothetical protein